MVFMQKNALLRMLTEARKKDSLFTVKQIQNKPVCPEEAVTLEFLRYVLWFYITEFGQKG